MNLIAWMHTHWPIKFENPNEGKVMDRIYQFRNTKLGVDWTSFSAIGIEEMKKAHKAAPDLGLEFRTLTVETNLPSPELTWLYTHCLAIGMTKKSDSGKWEHDIALFTSDLQARIRELEEKQNG